MLQYKKQIICIECYFYKSQGQYLVMNWNEWIWLLPSSKLRKIDLKYIHLTIDKSEEIILVVTFAVHIQCH